MLRQVRTDSAIDWIRPHLHGTRKPDDAIPSVGDFVPRGFRSYCRLLHSIFEHADVDDAVVSGVPPEWYGSEEHGARALSYLSIAEQLGIVVSDTFSARDIQERVGEGEYDRLVTGPESGYIVPWQLRALLDVLTTETRDALVYYYYDWEAVPASEEGRLYEGTLDDYMATWDIEDVRSSPTYAWPASRNWIVTSIEPFDYSFIGGTETLIKALLSHPTLECLAVDEATAARRG